MLKFIRIIQSQCDHHAELIFLNFKEKRNLEVLLQRARHELLLTNRASSSVVSLNGQNKQTSLHEYCLSTESLISELVIFNARIELYLNFLRRRLLVSVSSEVNVNFCKRLKVTLLFAKVISLLNDNISSFLAAFRGG